MKKWYRYIVCIMITGLILSGCGARKTVEEQVTENLLRDQTIKTKVYEEKEEPVVQVTENTEASDPVETTKDPSLPTRAGVVTNEETKDKLDPGQLQLVFLGDSIFDQDRGETGIPYMTAANCGAALYNLAIGGTPAARGWNEPGDNESWNSVSLIGITKAICGEVSPEIFSQYHAKEVFDKCDFDNTDYFIIEYGYNDFFSQVPITREDQTLEDTRYYYNAVYQSIKLLQKHFPNAEVIFCTPHYSNFKNLPFGSGDSNMLNNGYGTMYNYICAGYDAAHEADAVAINCVEDLGINGYTLEEMSSDGVHLTEAGRRLYAEMLSKRILKMEETRNN